MASGARWELLVRTSVGHKAAMALSGAVLTGWAALHMAGNLLVFGGPELINGYGAALQGGPIVWIQRAVVGLALATHVAGAWATTRQARRARPVGYRRGLTTQTATASGRSMRWGGVLLGLFLLYHVAHIYGPLHGSFVPGDVHHNVTRGLSDPLAGSLYLLATVAFGLHLHHGTWSLLRSLGHARPFARGLRRVSAAFAVALTIGYAAPCVAALMGWLG